jgi:uncharacterized protein YyaL (SSP411 family)
MEKLLNNLKDEKSLYLLQHASNPVKWISWRGFLKQKGNIDKPLLISIGYSSCHWCHVMAEESFEDDKIAFFINQNFIPIKIDKEEYPDLDKKYQFFAQITGQVGGWPLTIFADSDGEPFYAGTYFPKEERYGIPSFMNILKNILDIYRDSYEKVKKIIEDYKIFTKSFYSGEGLEIKDVDYSVFIDLLDYENGGLKGKTKFPNIPVLDYLLLYLDKDDNIRNFLIKTADALCLSGIYDHIDGGFFRYTVDSNWDIPHFEKMLYDNALNLSFLSKMYHFIENEIYLITAKRTADFCLEFFDTEIGFGASYDADSLDEDNCKKEGYYYRFSENLFSNLTIDEAELISKKCYFNENHIRLNKDIDLESFKQLQMIFDKLSLNRSKLKKRPAFDSKVIFSWNMLMISALLDFYEASGDEFYFNKAMDTFFKIFHTMFLDDGIKRISYIGDLFDHAVLEDYAYFLMVTNKLFSITKDKNFLSIAQKIVKNVKEKFCRDDILCYNTNKDVIDIFDDALPSSLGIFLNEVIFLKNYTNVDFDIKRFTTYAKKYHSNYPFATPSLGAFLSNINKEVL